MQSLEKANTFDCVINSYINLWVILIASTIPFLWHKVHARKMYNTVPLIAVNLTHLHGSKLVFQNTHRCATAQKAEVLAVEAD